MKKQKQNTQRLHPQHGITKNWEDIIYFSGGYNDGNNDKWNQ